MNNHFVLAGALAASLAWGSVARAQSTFPDVPDNHWAAQAVRRLAEVGIIEGFPAAPSPAAPTAKKKVASKPVPAKASRPAKTEPK